jgi:hypothetical protein
MQILPVLRVTEHIPAPINEVRARLEENTEVWIRNSKIFGKETRFNGSVQGDEFKLNIKHSYQFCRSGPVVGSGKLSEENGKTLLAYVIWPGMFTSIFDGVLVAAMGYGLAAQIIEAIGGNFSFGMVFYAFLSVFLVANIYCSFNPRAAELRAAISEVANAGANE